MLTQARFTTWPVWRDDDGEYHENPQALKLFASIRYALRKQLRYPMWCYNTKRLPLDTHLVSWFGYTTGAAEWCVSGKGLRQEQGGFVGFSVDERIHEDLGQEPEQSRG